MDKGRLSFRLNIVLCFFFTSIAIIFIISFSFYNFIKNKLYEEIRINFKNTIELGAYGLPIEPFSRLVKLISEVSKIDLNDPKYLEMIDKIENSTDYKLVYGHLNKIRNTRPDLLLFVYTLVPTETMGMAKFVVDADVLRLKESKDKNIMISHFAQNYDISKQNITMKALKENKIIIADEFVYDKEYKTNSMMGFAPIIDPFNGTQIGVLGVDISDKNISNFLNMILIITFIISLISIIIVFILSILLGNSISKPIIYLSTIVKKFTSRDFAARANPESNIKEIYDLIVNFNNMAETIGNYSKYLQDLNGSYERFVPVEFLNYLSKSDITQVELGDQIQKEMSVLFTDIRSFSTLSEALTPKETFDFLNNYLKVMGPIIRNNNGFVDKYLGDGVMAIFPLDAEDALKAAIDIKKALKDFNEKRTQSGYPPIRIGIGVHTGTVMLGTIGEEKRMQGTVISDAVNLASRIDGLTKDFESTILITKEVLSKIPHPENYKHRFLGQSSVKGRVEPVSIFEIFDYDNPEILERKEETKTELESAIYYFNSGKIDEALKLFEKIKEKFPKDKVLDIYIDRCKCL